MVIPREVGRCAIISSGIQNVDPETAEGRIIWLLVPVDQTRGAANHIPDASGHALCKRELKLSLWRIEERLVDETLMCNICRLKRAKLARS